MIQHANISASAPSCGNSLEDSASRATSSARPYPGCGHTVPASSSPVSVACPPPLPAKPLRCGSSLVIRAAPDAEVSNEYEKNVPDTLKDNVRRESGILLSSHTFILVQIVMAAEVNDLAKAINESASR